MHRFAIEKRFPVLKKNLNKFSLKKDYTEYQTSLFELEHLPFHFSGIHVNFKFIFWVWEIFSVVVMIFGGVWLYIIDKIQDANANWVRVLARGLYDKLKTLKYCQYPELDLDKEQ